MTMPFVCLRIFMFLWFAQLGFAPFRVEVDRINGPKPDPRVDQWNALIAISRTSHPRASPQSSKLRLCVIIRGVFKFIKSDSLLKKYFTAWLQTYQNATSMPSWALQLSSDSAVVSCCTVCMTKNLQKRPCTHSSHLRCVVRYLVQQNTTRKIGSVNLELRRIETHDPISAARIVHSRYSLLWLYYSSHSTTVLATGYETRYTAIHQAWAIYIQYSTISVGIRWNQGAGYKDYPISHSNWYWQPGGVPLFIRAL